MHWSEDEFWSEALERYQDTRENGTRTITLDLDGIERNIYKDDGPAYRTLYAMQSVLEQEGMDGFRGAPRVVLALLMHLSDLSTTSR